MCSPWSNWGVSNGLDNVLVCSLCFLKTVVYWGFVQKQIIWCVLSQQGTDGFYVCLIMMSPIIHKHCFQMWHQHNINSVTDESLITFSVCLVSGHRPGQPTLFCDDITIPTPIWWWWWNGRVFLSISWIKCVRNIIMYGLAWIMILGHSWNDLPMIFACDCITYENHWRITSHVMKKM